MHTALRRLAALAAAAAATSPALAGLHQICFEGEPDAKTGHRIVVAACEDDSGARCRIGATDGVNTIAPVTPSTPQPVAMPAPPAGVARSVAYFPLVTDTQVFFRFANGTQRECWQPTRFSRRAEGQLASFSTDVSGLATTGVWQLKARTGGLAQPRLPEGFVPVGGGTFVIDQLGWVRDTHSDWSNGSRWWSLGELESSLPATTLVGYVVGLRIGNMFESDLYAGGAYVLTGGGVPTATVARHTLAAPLIPGTVDPSDVVVGGGFFGLQAASPNTGMFVAASRPVRTMSWLYCALRLPRPAACPQPMPAGWHVEARHPAGAAQGTVAAQLTLMPRDLSVIDRRTGAQSKWELRSTLIGTTSAAAVAPGATTQGLRGAYAVTEVGVASHWPAATGNDPFKPVSLVSRLEPRADLGGATAQAQPGSAGATPTNLTTYALGLKLVRPGSKPDQTVPPEWVRVSDYCLGDVRLQKLEMCQRSDQVVTPTELCKLEPGLAEWGYCRSE